VADLFDGSQKKLARDRNSGGGNNFAFRGSLNAGYYYIQIRVMYHGGKGPYELILGNGKDHRYVEGKKGSSTDRKTGGGCPPDLLKWCKEQNFLPLKCLRCRAQHQRIGN